LLLWWCWQKGWAAQLTDPSVSLIARDVTLIDTSCERYSREIMYGWEKANEPPAGSYKVDVQV
jgi:hypothetical protein